MSMTLIQSIKVFGNLLQKSAPYLLLELLLPGGTLFAVLLFLYERRHRLATPKPSQLNVVVAHAIGKLRKEFVYVVQPNGTAASVWRGGVGKRGGFEVLAMAPAR